ncbi:MAG: DUF6377 domain-containing protein [Phocaeicola sp.]
MIKPLYLIYLSLIVLLLVGCSTNELNSLTAQLDYLIDNKSLYEQKKEEVIQHHREMLRTPNLTIEQEYEINLLLYRDFLKYNTDSSICYIERNRSIAEILQCDSMLIDSKLILVPLYSSVGYYVEAKRILDGIDTTLLNPSELEKYYAGYATFYYHYSQTCYNEKYQKISNAYSDSASRVRKTDSSESLIGLANSYITTGNYREAEEIYERLLDDEGGFTYDYASLANTMGIIQMYQEKVEQAKKYYILSAIADIINCKKENASLNSLASIYQSEGDLSKAFKYTQSAIDDANFSKNQFRAAQLSKLYSITNVMYQKEQARSKSTLKTYILVISILTFVLILFIIYTYRQMGKMSRIKREVSIINTRLINLNKLLNESNSKLTEANRVKEQYIAQFFELCSDYIDKMENNRKIRYKLIVNRKIEELTMLLKSTTNIKNEAEELFRNFDSIFLGLYPTFVAEFNALLNPEEQIVLKADDLLNRELRIYALLRLGITDNFKIASFLRCSMSTVYNYRTRARNKAIISRDDFEDSILRIGSITK